MEGVQDGQGISIQEECRVQTERDKAQRERLADVAEVTLGQSKIIEGLSSDVGTLRSGSGCVVVL
jgi:hypothetical protein